MILALECTVEQILFHPKIVHLPIALAILMPLLTGGLLVAWWRNWLPKRAWTIAVLFQIVLLATGYLALRTGKDEEEVVGQLVDGRFLGAHHAAANDFLYFAVAALVFFVGAALIKHDGVAKAFGVLSLVGSIAVFVAGFRVGEAGGALVYEHAAPCAYGTAGGACVPVVPSDDHTGGHDHDHDH